MVINEIMYDLDGTDTDREWIEIANSGSDTVDLTSWRFEEGETQHTLVLKQGSAQLASGQYAVIVDNYEKFLQDNSGFSGAVFDSSYSLSNTGENLKLRDAQNGNVINEVTYSSDWGAADDGNSLQRKPDNSWIAAAPTGGSLNATEPAPSPQPSPTVSSSQSNTTSSSSKTGKSPNPSPKNSPSPASSKKTASVLGSSQSAEITASPAAGISLSVFPTPTAEPKVDKSSNKIKIAGAVAGSGAIIMGLSAGLYFWFRPKSVREKEESGNN